MNFFAHNNSQLVEVQAKIRQDNLGYGDFKFRSGNIYLSVGLLLMVTACARASLEFGLQSVLSALFWCFIYSVSLRLAYSNVLNKISDEKVKKIAEIFAVIGMLGFTLQVFQQHLLQGLLDLTAWLVAALAVQLISKRNFYFILTASFVFLLFACAQTREGHFILYLFFYAIIAVICFMHLLEEQYYQQAAAALKDARKTWLPAGAMVLAMFLLLGSVLFYFALPQPQSLNWGSSIGDGGEDYHDEDWYEEAAQQSGDDFFQHEPSTNGGDQRGRDAGSGDSGARDRSGNNPNSQADGQSANSSYAGFQEEFDINHPRDADNENDLIMYVQADRSLYLRAKTFSHFDGSNWSNWDNQLLKHRLKRGQYQFAGFEALTEFERQHVVEQTIEMALDGSSNIVASPEILKLEFAGSVFAVDRYGNLRAPRPLKKGVRYVVHSLITLHNGHPYDSAPGATLSAEERMHYLQLPRGLDPRYAELAKQISHGHRDGFHQAKRVEQYLRTEYQYSLGTLHNKTDSGNLERFLFETRIGHCEYFASAMTLLVRSLKIPARLATGYSVTHYNPLTGYFEVRELDGHAWVEVYIDSVGWVSFEPTAFYQLPNATKPSTAEAMQHYLEELQRVAEAVDPESAQTNWIELITQVFVVLKQVVGYMAMILGILLKIIFESALPYLVIMLAMALMIYVSRNYFKDIYAVYRINAFDPADANLSVCRCYLELEQWQARRGLGRNGGETLQEFKQRLLIAGLEAAPLDQLVSNYIALYYGGINQSEQSATQSIDAIKKICTLKFRLG